MSTEMRNVAINRDSFEALVSKYQRPLYLYALRILRNREDAEDAVQEAFLRVYRGWTKYDAKLGHQARLRAWFCKITLNVVRNRLRIKRLAQVSLDEMSDFKVSHSTLEDRLSPDVILDRHTTIDLVERAIRELPSHLLETARLRFIEGLSHSEIARRCSHRDGTVKSHVFRAKRMLRKALQPVFV